ncbi:DUF302 domain-containing protein [Geodermatophilus sp. SYSU D00525]
MTDALVVVAAPGDVPSTVALVTAALHERRVPLVATIDHAAGAREAGLQQDDVLLVFGDPAVGTAPVQADPRAGLDLPLRVLVWSESGSTHLAHHDPRGLADRYALGGRQAVLTALHDLLAGLVTTAVGAGARGPPSARPAEDRIRAVPGTGRPGRSPSRTPCSRCCSGPGPGPAPHPRGSRAPRAPGVRGRSRLEPRARPVPEGRRALVRARTGRDDPREGPGGSSTRPTCPAATAAGRFRGAGARAAKALVTFRHS